MRPTCYRNSSDTLENTGCKRSCWLFTLCQHRCGSRFSWYMDSALKIWRIQRKQICVQSPPVQEALDQEVRANQVKSVNLILLSRCETCWVFQIEDWLSFHVVFCLNTRWWISGPPKLAVFWPAACHANNPLPCSPKAVVSLQYLDIFDNENSSSTRRL